MAQMPRTFSSYPRRAHASGRARLTLGRRSVYLRGEWNSPESWDHYNELRKAWQASTSIDDRSIGPLSVANLVASYLSWLRLHRSPSSCYHYGFYGNAFAALYGTLAASDVRPFHLQRWIDAKLTAGAWNATTVNDVTRWIIRIFNWGVEQGLLERNPLAGMRRPRALSRPRAATEAEYRALLRHGSPPLRRLVLALWLTGARPCELRALTWDQWHGDRLVLSEHKTSATDRQRRDRVIFLTPMVQRLLGWLSRYGKSHNANIFLNTDSQPWTAGALCQAVARIKRVAGLASDLSLYSIRHSWITRALVAGVSPAAVAALAGNSVAMVSQVYNHVNDQHTFLAAEAARAARGKAG